ncbi:MAG TPA: tetratricopeptide repeat protein [Sphingomicrobium sp.]|nr:tetratricopeptide repeat protein [Sphingomicrobium sp.]
MKAANPDLAYGIRAQMALQAGDFASAVDLAEKAVEATPGDATVRGLLGNAYFAAGRFASADAAYADALALSPAEPQIILKRALTQIAQGKNGEALSLLESARYYIDAADYGLAVALAGQPAEAVSVLEPAARAQGADARVRQNLALAYALGGDWTAARTIAAQDLAPDQVDARVQQWMALAKPTRASDQVAALIGVTPAAVDPGQPVQLALNQDAAKYAAAAPAAAPAPQPQAEVAEAAPAFGEPVAAPAPQAVAEAAPAPSVAPEAQSIAAAAAIAPEAPAAFAMMSSSFAPAPEPAAPKKPAPVRPAAKKASGDSKAVVQLGAYSSAERVSVAWERLTKKYPVLANYSPMRARFDSPKGTVWRLSIKGFDSQREAIAQCHTLRNRGGNCFVRSSAGDSPVQFASR